MEKVCKSCSKNKPYSEFYDAPKNKDGKSGVCKKCRGIKNKAWQKRNYKRYKQYNDNWRKVNVERIKRAQRLWWQNLKLTVLTHYSGGTPVCAHCGFDDIRALSIDHIKGGGTQHRAAIARGHQGHVFYHWLRKQSYPLGYQVLCMNCQFIKREEKEEYGRQTGTK